MTWFISKIAGVVGDRFARPVAIGIAALLLIGGVFLLGRCTGDNSDAFNSQADQTTRSSDSIADAAENAIETLEGRTATEDAIDEAVTQAVNEIEGAQSATAVRNAVLSGVCGRVEHRNDPACSTRAENRP